MLSLCLYDLVYLISSMMIFSLPLLMPSLVMSVRFTYSIPYLLPLAHIAMTGSIYTTMAIAIERYITVCHPFFKISHNWSPSKYIIPILTFSIAYNAPKFAELEVIQLEGGEGFSCVRFDTFLQIQIILGQTFPTIPEVKLFTAFSQQH